MARRYRRLRRGGSSACPVAHRSAPESRTGPDTRVAFRLASSTPARLTLLDLQGRIVASRRLEGAAPGLHEVELSTGPGLAAGIYFIRLTQGGESRVTKISVVP
jgi:hypothetical protein